MDEDLTIATKDFAKIADSCSKMGYVEGVEAGKENGLKDGFVDGFISGISICLHSAILTGRMSALKVFYEKELSRSSDEGTGNHYCRLLDKLQTLLREFHVEDMKEEEKLLVQARKDFKNRINFSELKGDTDKKLFEEEKGNCERTGEVGKIDMPVMDIHEVFGDMVHKFPANSLVNEFSIKVNTHDSDLS